MTFLHCSSFRYSDFPAYSQIVLRQTQEYPELVEGLHRALPREETCSLALPLSGVSTHILKALAGATAPYRENFHQEIFVLSKCECERLSNPIRYPRFRVSVSGVRQYSAFAFGVPHDINGFHPYTMSSMYLSHPLVVPYLSQIPG